MPSGSSTAQTPTGRGRPRLVPARRRGQTAREEILDAAAELFTRHGYTGTSTRMIAEAVGIRQASMYHYFGTKDDILATLLETTVVASLERARVLLDENGDALARLLELARFDVDQLAQSRWNLGALYLLPEVADQRFVEFRSARQELADSYAALSAAALGDATDKRTLLPFRLVESVIMMRADEQRGELGEHTAAGLAATVVDAISRIL
ncbi:TetR/AcrR family transcriptional regulator [Gordonia sp. NPDC127522]|uniref:TetR/AcrR family transcriptional regulator n=1 Tax=Gordonia sp. NPDC127522 TaxID=3345390 RepID=UPI003642C9D2